MNTQLIYRTTYNISHFMCLIAIHFALLRGDACQAAIYTWTFEGTVTQGLAGSPYQANLPYAVYFSVDSTHLSTVASGLYYPTVGYGFTENSLVGPVGFGASSVGSAVLIANNQRLGGGGSFDGIVFSMFGETNTSFPFDGSAFGITLVNNSTGATATPFTDTSFPATLDLSQFSQRYMTVYFGDGVVKGSVDSLYLNGVLISQVPEPNVIDLLTLSVVLAASMFVRLWKSTEMKTCQHRADCPLSLWTV